MKAIVTFVATAYTLSIALSLVIGLTGGHQSALIGFGYLSWILAGISVCSAYFSVKEPPHIQWNRFPLKSLPLALFLIPFILHATMLRLMSMAEGGLRWED